MRRLGRAIHIHHLHNPMNNRQRHNNAPKPAMQQIKLIKRDTQPNNQRIVPPSHDHQRNHIEHRQRPRAVSEMLQQRLMRQWIVTRSTAPFDPHAKECEIHCQNAHQYEKLKATRQDAHVDSEQAHFSAVLAAEERGVEEVFFEKGEQGGSVAEVALGVVVETGEGADVASDVHRDVVDEGEADETGQDDEEGVAIVDVSCLDCFLHNRGVVWGGHD